ncbi:MAG TPA: MOSC N-terminal beta barrel domain-containing protein [Polyangiaceae bacterium]|nr:MOSC N-terminal beta barrel domain-containing protein [Polyangiaceae bacterium]
MAEVSALYFYPIKSCRGIRVQQWPVVARGFLADRRWMLVDASGKFVTQREFAQLALVHTELDGERLRISAPGQAALALPITHESGDLRTVEVWQDRAFGFVHPLGSAWFSRYLEEEHQLVYMPEHHRRQVNPARANGGDIVGFADAYPFLLISEASLADLNSRLDAPVSMDRFRPNIVICGAPAFAEDAYAHVRIGDISFRGVKRCERCVITTIDPVTGLRDREPLRTLAQYRSSEGKVWFGMNLIHDQLGLLRVGDAVSRNNGG